MLKIYAYTLSTMEVEDKPYFLASPIRAGHMTRLNKSSKVMI
jgi:hypothetical protein